MNLRKTRKFRTAMLGKVLAMVVGIFVCAGAFAQSKTVTGIVSEPDGEPAVGATVLVKGTAAAVATNVDGKYTLNVPEGGKTLQVRYIGMKTKEVEITGDVINITLESDASILDEVVVIGYGTVKKRDLTGPVSSVGEKALKDIPVATAAEAITGKLPGVQVTTTEGSPDADIKIRVRGGGSITQSNTPLYIVDGFPVNSISDIAPSEIQTIDVLKDASTGAIYGARGANGVIIITTKSAKEGKLSVSYNGYIGYKKIAKTLDVLNPYQFASRQYERAILADKVGSEYEPYFGSYQDINLYNYVKGSDWQDIVFGDTGTTYNQSVSVSGGSKQANYNASYNRISDDAIMIGSNYERDNFNLKLNMEPMDWLKMNVSVRYSDTKVKGGGANDVTGSEKSPSDTRLKNAVVYTPIELHNMASPDDDSESASNLHPPTKTIPDSDREKRNKIFNINGGLTITPLKGLSLRSEVGAESNYGEDNRFMGLTTYYVTSGNAAYKNHPAIELNNTEYYSFRNTNTVTYDIGQFLSKDHGVSVMLGEEMISTKGKYLRTEVQNFPVDFNSQMAWKFSTQGTAISTDNYYNTENNLLSYFGRLSYDYKGRYLLTTTFRADGSSKFAPGKQWGYFPSVALAWRLSDEKFMENTAGWLSNAKLRASYGSAGNNNIGADLYKQIYTSSSTTYIPASLSTSYWSAGASMSNPDLRWETTITRNFGLDFGFWKNRINGSVEVYDNNTKDLLIDYPTSGVGYVTQMRNLGKTSNKGIEFNVDALLVNTKDFSLNFGFNISANKNRVEELGGLENVVGNEAWTSMTEASNSYRVIVGQPIGLMYGYVTEGMYSADDFTWNGSRWVAKAGVVDNSSITGLSWGPGALKLRDVSGPDGVPDGKITEDDRVKIGDANPKFFGAFNLSSTFKGFDLSANFNYVYGNDIYNANRIEFSSQYYRYRNEVIDGVPYTQVDPSGLRVTDPAALNALNSDATTWASPTGRYVFHSWAVEDGSFIRLSSLTLGYTLPKNLVSKAYIQQLRFYVSAYNLYTWTNYSGYDPEVDTRRKTGLTPGVDYSAYPKSRSINFGVNLTF